MNEYTKEWNFRQKLDDTWEAISEKGFSVERKSNLLIIENLQNGDAPVYLRPCSIYGDKIDIDFADFTEHSGIFICGFLAGFEYIDIRIDLKKKKLHLYTHEFHKKQPVFFNFHGKKKYQNCLGHS
ncbi:MAG: hypothetical protein NC907_03630 [Candidatus Omnitrophica bacterium]|nr:hypothetical protein [Candidatus Omnitrophota bacterium]MCM8788863.1 hypothetical protein [Candidatus Omnitrophota bacterium]